MSEIGKPTRIFKYTSFCTAQKIIKNGNIKFSKPSVFNDPFDCDIDILKFDFTSELSEEVKRDIREVKKICKNNPKFSEAEKEKSFWEDAYKESQINKIKSSCITCFSLVNDSVLMWSHYAEKHEGICLEFDNSISPRFENLNDNTDISEGQVLYSDYEEINYLSIEKREAIRRLFISKNSSWSYEKEYRMILLKDKPEYQNFNPQFLKSIYFGLKVSTKSIKEFIKLCHSFYHKDLKYFKCEKNNLTISIKRLSMNSFGEYY